MSFVIDVLVEVLKRWARGSIKGALIFFLGLSFLGCEQPSSDSAEAGAPALNPGGGSPLAETIEVKHGVGFSCFNRLGEIQCAGVNPTLGLNSPGVFVVVASLSSGNFSALEVWDDTLCFSAVVSTSPWDRTRAGLSSYCIGEASLGPNYSAYPMVYSPPFVTASHGSAELTFNLTPFAGHDGNMDVFTDTGGNWLVMTDSSAGTSEETLSCSSLDQTLTCPTFTAVIQ